MQIPYCVLLIGGLFQLILSFILKTKNVRSTIMFKVIPFALSINEIIIALYLLDIINITIK
jgi:hypothetical protein